MSAAPGMAESLCSARRLPLIGACLQAESEGISSDLDEEVLGNSMLLVLASMLTVPPLIELRDRPGRPRPLLHLVVDLVRD